MKPTKLVRMAQSGLHVLRHHEVVPPRALIHMIVEPTTACPLRCIMCKREQYLEENCMKSRHLDVETFQEIYDQTRPLKLLLCGLGESLANPRLPAIIRHAVDGGTDVATTTSATLNAFPLCDLVESGLGLLKVSIDAATAETYRTIRGLDKHSEVLDRVREVIELRRRRNRKKPALRFQFVVQGANYHESAALVRLARDLGVDAIYFKPLFLFNLESKTDELLGEARFEDVIEALKEARAEVRDNRPATNLDAMIHHDLAATWEHYRQSRMQQTSPPEVIRKCPWPWFSLFVNVAGDVRPCCYFGAVNESWGNLLEVSFEEIWNGDGYRELRRKLHAGQPPHDRCAVCRPQSLTEIMRTFGNILPGFVKGT